MGDLGRLTGSVVGYYMPSAYGKPEVGMGATLVMWSDRHAYTITRVSASGKTFWMKRDIAKRIDNNGMSEMQDYEFTTNPNAHEECVRMTKRGWMSRGSLVRVGYRSEYYDFSY